jgi:hypothetical protein
VRLRPTDGATPPGLLAALTQRIAGHGREGDTLFGSWSATRWQYASRDRPERQVDVVCDLGGSVTLSLSEGTYVLTWDLGEGSRSLGGAIDVDADRLTLRPLGAADEEVVVFRVASDTLSLSAESSAWDLDADGTEEAAAFVAVLVRL